MAKIKLPELKVSSFVTSFTDEDMQKVNGGHNQGQSSELITCPNSWFFCTPPPPSTETACSTTDVYGPTHCGGKGCKMDHIPG